MYKDLIAWRKAYKFTLNIYYATKSYPREELFGITSQMRRAASSIPANLAEGSMYNSAKEFKRYINIARGSMAELEVWLLLSRDLKYIDNEQFSGLSNDLDEIGKLLNGLLKSL